MHSLIHWNLILDLLCEDKQNATQYLLRREQVQELILWAAEQRLFWSCSSEDSSSDNPMLRMVSPLDIHKFDAEFLGDHQWVHVLLDYEQGLCVSDAVPYKDALDLVQEELDKDSLYMILPCSFADNH